ncbi:hypothetical protein [Streptomyces sp. NPDC002851]
METFVTVAVVVTMIALGVLLIHQLNSQHGDHSTAFHYGRSGTPVPGPAPSTPRKARGRAGARGTGARRAWLRLRRRTRTPHP